MTDTVKVERYLKIAEVHETHGRVHTQPGMYPPPIPPDGICVHMEEKIISPVEPNTQGVAREMAVAMKQLQQQIGPMINPQEKIISEAIVVFTHDEYSKAGKPAPGDKVRMTLEIELDA